MPSHTQRATLLRDYRRLLKSLAGGNTYLQHLGETAGDERWLLSGSNRRSTVPASIAKYALGSGAVVPLKDGHASGRYHLSEEGRLALKRLLCAGDGSQLQHRDLGARVIKSDLGPAPERVTVNQQESPLAWLASRRDKNGNPLLDAALIEAGERLRSDYTFAALMPSSGRGWQTERTGSGRSSSGVSDLTDDVLSARKRVQSILGRLEPTLAGIAVDVCCHLKGLTTVEAERGWPARSAKVVLQIALSSLADEYGTRVSGPARSARPQTWRDEAPHSP